MRELAMNEIHQIAGGDFIKDVTGIYNDGLSGQSLTVGVLSLSTGVLLGSLMPKFAPICAIGALIAYAIYDAQQVNSTVQVKAA
ncbi:MAG: hypothetical protein AB7I18_00160 [Candidatus Berkiella sp.]